jgi:beta-galactosidase
MTGTVDYPWPNVDGIAYGGDYTPEQWPRQTWHEDVALMREAGVNLVSIGIFTWGLLEPRPGEFDFEWLDEIIDLLHANGISVDLATPTASPPAWFFADHPDSRVVTREGVALGFGARGMAAPTSPAYREATIRIATALAQRYGSHPAVVLWHVHNEYGAPVAEDYSEHSQRAFRRWLRTRYGSLDALNDAWGTSFWGQHYTEWHHIDLPRLAPSVVNPAQRLDFARFMDAELRQCFIAERDAIRRHASQPITTNFMANQTNVADLWKWAAEVDVVSDDHYLWAADPEAEIGLAIAADLTRSVAGGKPWVLMEHSTSAVNWQPRNIAKQAGEMARNSLTHLARGADGILFFQWRASRFGAEKFHSAMVPHAGTGSRVWNEVVALGSQLNRLGEVRGSRVTADVAILWDFESIWAQNLEWRPSVDVDPVERIRAFYEELWRAGITTDFALPGGDLSRYRLVVAPAQYLLTEADADNLSRYVERGGTLVVSFFSGIVDASDAVHRGGFGAPLSQLLGLRIEEFLPFREDTAASVRWGDAEYASDLWQEHLELTQAEIIATNVAGPASGRAAVTRNEWGTGAAWYVSTRLSAPGMRVLLSAALSDAGIPARATRGGLEVIVRRHDDASYTFAINHRDTPEDIEGHGVELLTGVTVAGRFTVPAGGVAVLRHIDETATARIGYD